MKRGIRSWKSYAREVLRGSYGKPILGLVLVAVLNGVCSTLTAGLFPGYSVTAVLLGQAFAFILSLILWLISTGYSYMLLNQSRDRAYSVKDMVYFLVNQPDRLIPAAFVLALINLVCSVPLNYFSYTSMPAATLEGQAAQMGQYLALMLVTDGVITVLALPFSMAPYLLADQPEMGGWEALKTSVGMMKGHKLQYLLLQLSFIPWIFLSVFTFYIGLLWVFPYMEMATVMFYRDLRGEFDPAPAGTQKVSGKKEELSWDDDHSEA